MTYERTRKPTHPGHILKELYLNELSIGISNFAEHIGVSRKTVSAIVNGHARVTPELAVRFALALPMTTAEMWLNLQRECDLFDAVQAVSPASILPFAVAIQA